MIKHWPGKQFAFSLKAISWIRLWPRSALGTMNFAHSLRMKFVIYSTDIYRCKTVGDTCTSSQQKTPNRKSIQQQKHIPPSQCTSSCNKNIDDCSLWSRRLNEVNAGMVAWKNSRYTSVMGSESASWSLLNLAWLSSWIKNKTRLAISQTLNNSMVFVVAV